MSIAAGVSRWQRSQRPSAHAQIELVLAPRIQPLGIEHEELAVGVGLLSSHTGAVDDELGRALRCLQERCLQENPIDPACVLPAPPAQANDCDGTESILNPASCTQSGATVVHQLAVMRIHVDCNQGYDLDSCNGAMNNAVVRMTASATGFSHGMLGATADVAIAALVLDQFGGGVLTLEQLYDINPDLSGDSNYRCDVLSMTLDITGTAMPQRRARRRIASN